MPSPAPIELPLHEALANHIGTIVSLEEADQAQFSWSKQTKPLIMKELFFYINYGTNDLSTVKLYASRGYL